ncbi:MAG: hypothetical protein AAF985_19805, partial [Bacteroidota bacterium]
LFISITFKNMDHNITSGLFKIFFFKPSLFCLFLGLAGALFLWSCDEVDQTTKNRKGKPDQEQVPETDSTSTNNPSLFIGHAPYKGFLESGKSVSANDFIGFLRIKGMNNVADSGSIELMYFRDYQVDANEVVSFIDFIPEENQLYYFNLTTARIPFELEYRVLNHDRTSIIPYQKLKSEVDTNYYGLLLLNIHPVEERGGRYNRLDTSFAAKTFIKPNYHYATGSQTFFTYNKYLQGCWSKYDIPQKIGGPRGCETFATFGQDKIPFFELTDISVKEKSLTGYYMMTVGTDQTIGYFQFDTKEDLLCLTDIIQKAKPSRADDKLGIAMYDYKKYEVKVSRDNYGVHCVTDIYYDGSIQDTTYAWAIGFFGNNEFYKSEQKE